MKALVLEAYNTLVYTDVPRPAVAEHEVLIQVMACGICGSDVHGLDGSTGRRVPPLIMGHEASGIIVEAGAKVEGWKPGDRVTFDSTIYPLDDWYTLRGRYNLSDNRQVLGVSTGDYRRHGAFAEYVAVPSHILYRIPDSVTFEQAAMVEAAAVALHAVNLAGPRIGDVCLVTGAGTIGLFLIKLLRLAGVSQVAAVDIDERSVVMALNAGAGLACRPGDDRLAEAVRSWTGGRGADVSFEAVGLSATVELAIRLVRKGGTVVLVGNLSPKIEFPLQKVVTGELKIQGSCAIRGEYAQILDLLAAGRLRVDDQIAAVAPLRDGAAWFGRLVHKQTPPGKVILVP
jgi:2-desacetyl-2-hydroxyethyl bacteriochlorophyllide A dehydrogenase